MAGFVKKVISRKEALDEISLALSFPWNVRQTVLPLGDAIGRRCAAEVTSAEDYPPYSRSLRDGYAVRHADANGATQGTPLFLNKRGEVRMGVVPDFAVSASEAASIPTGGLLPEGADAVVMLEDTDCTGGWIEVRRGVQAGENVIHKGEEIKAGQRLLEKGSLVDFKTIGLLATAGLTELSVMAPKISILSTGDEIVPSETKEVPPGSIRDVNGWNLKALLASYGFHADYRGIVSDDGAEFEARFHKELAACDILILSGGSSVGMRDRCSQLLEAMPAPGLLVRGLNIVPGKPTLAAADACAHKIAVSLPGHPLSCLTAAFVFLLPLIARMACEEPFFCGVRTRLPLACDVAARTGPEEFIPCALTPDGKARPLSAKSGYISVLSKADGLIRIAEDAETKRAGEDTEVWLWQ